MCGIITIVKRKNDGVATPATILGMLKEQIERGSEGFGYVAFDKTIESYVRRETKAQIEVPLEKCTSPSIMFHHRMPTSTPNFADCTHPIKVSHKELKYDYYIVHNGVISNHSILHDKHIELGYKYQTYIKTTVETLNNTLSKEKWNDSEALAIDISRFIEAKQDKIESRGSIAFVSLQVNKKTNEIVGIFFGRNTSPLTAKLTDSALILRSEGEELDTKPNVLYRLDIKTWDLTEEEVAIGEVMSVNYNRDWSDSKDYNKDYYSRHHTTYLPPSNNNNYSKADQAIIDSFRNTKERELNDKIELKEETIGILFDEIEYYHNAGNAISKQEAKDKLEQEQDELEALQNELERLIDETGGDVTVE